MVPAAHRAGWHFLTAEKQRLLYAFVTELASGMGVPRPSRIAVDCSVNSYCIFPGGITGLFRSGFDMVVGLPLVADVVQLAGVLAHELGHAARRTLDRAALSQASTRGFRVWHSSAMKSMSIS